MADSFEMIKRAAEEIVTEDELRGILATEGPRKGYVGIEPSGLMHTGHLILGNMVRMLQGAGVHMDILLADWHAYINDKLGGNLENIRTCGKYMEDAFIAMGVERSKIKFVYASDYIGDSKYWETLIRLSKATSMQRVKRALTIMGRKEDEAELDSSKMIYPLMQVSDIFYLGVDIAYGGMDQRKAHMLARDIAEKLGWKKPTAIHTPLLAGLAGAAKMDMAEAKMSKSNPDSAIFIHDTPEEINRKLKKAFCPEKVVEGNPVIDIAKFIIFPRMGKMTIVRPEKWGGNLELNSVEELVKKFGEGAIHPMDLKSSVGKNLAEILAPIQAYFKEHPSNYEAVKKFMITR